MARTRRLVVVIAGAIAVMVGASLVLRSAGPERKDPPCRWLAGDLDVHTVYTATRVRDVTSEDAATFALTVEEQAALARNRDLDFLAITDFDDVSAQSDASYGGEGLIWIPGYEHRFAGIAQLLGATKRYASGSSTRSVERVARSLHAEGGVLQVAHTGDRLWPRAYGTSIEPDALEVWFNGPWSYDPGDVDKDMTASIGFYDRLLDEGHRVAVSGGSNSLLRGLYKLAGIGQPTTWVCAQERTVGGVLSAIQEGRSTISHEFPSQGPLTESEAGGGGGADAAESGSGGFTRPPPTGTKVPFVSIEGDRPGGTSFEATLGDDVGVGDPLRVGVFDAPFSVLRLVGDGSRVLDEVEVFSPTFVHEFRVPEGVSWVRAEVFALPEDTVGGPCELGPKVATYCDDRIGMLALSSPIYVSEGPTPTISPGSSGP